MSTVKLCKIAKKKIGPKNNNYNLSTYAKKTYERRNVATYKNVGHMFYLVGWNFIKFNFKLVASAREIACACARMFTCHVHHDSVAM